MLQSRARTYITTAAHPIGFNMSSVAGVLAVALRCMVAGVLIHADGICTLQDYSWGGKGGLAPYCLRTDLF